MIGDFLRRLADRFEDGFCSCLTEILERPECDDAGCAVCESRQLRKLADMVDEEAAKTCEACREDMAGRLMPEGYEWPRYDTGEPLRYKDKYVHDGAEREVWHIDFDSYGDATILNVDGSKCSMDKGERGERVKRPAPKVLDADGVEVEVGDDLYSVEGMIKFHVSAIDRKNSRIATEAMFALDKWADPKMYTHRAPVLAADGKPLREGETVWLNEMGLKSKLVDRGEPLKVVAFDKKGNVGVLDRDGIVLGETSPWWFSPSCLTHERPDSWERLEKDAKQNCCEYACGRDGLCPGDRESCSGDYWEEASQGMATDLLRRAKRLAERGER